MVIGPVRNCTSAEILIILSNFLIQNSNFNFKITKMTKSNKKISLGTVVVVFCAASAHQNINPELTRKVWFQRQTHTCRQTTELCTLYIAQCGMRQSLRRMRQSLRRMRSCSALHSSVGHIMGVAVHCGPYCGCCSALWEYLSAILFLNSVRTKSKKDRQNTSSFRVLAELRHFER